MELTDTSNLRVTGVARLALADEAAWQVSAQAVLSAGSWGSTLVDIDTAGSNILWVICPAILTHAVGILLLSFAVCMLATCHTLARLCKHINNEFCLISSNAFKYLNRERWEDCRRKM